MTTEPARRSLTGDSQADVPSSILPPERLLPMLDQCLTGVGAEAPQARSRDPWTAERIGIVIVWFALTAWFAEQLYTVVSVPAMTPLQAVFLVLSVLTFAWVAFGTTLCATGFLRRLFATSVDTLAVPADASLQPGPRCALLFPVFHEDMAEIAATVEALADDAARPRLANRCDVFILSDSRSAEVERVELAAARLLADRVAGRLAVYYRRRGDNVDRKAGNIRDWIERHGGGYDSFVVFDADSRMSARTLAVLIAALEAHPRAGLIQTVPRLAAGSSLLTRLAAFGAAVQGPPAVAGLTVWQREAGNYWGHNAIVRTEAFAASAGLPRLPGLPPLGGTILSHDFVEAALLRRAGWEVHLVPGLGGTSEGSPPRLDDVMVRDRRWAQGNLQHLRLLTMPGLPWISRLHLALGAAAYLSAVCWAATLAVGMVLAVQAWVLVPTYFGSEPSLFPDWPRFDPEAALPLFGWTMAAVFLPKLLGLVLAWRTAERGTGGRLLAGGLAETLASALIAPMLMAAQTRAVVEILARRDAGWRTQRRDGAPPTLRDALTAHAGKAVVGLLLLVIGLLISGALVLWLLPIGLGLALAPAIDWVTARPAPPWLAAWLLPPGPDEDAWAAYHREARVVLWRAMLGAGNTVGGR